MQELWLTPDAWDSPGSGTCEGCWLRHGDVSSSVIPLEVTAGRCYMAKSKQLHSAAIWTLLYFQQPPGNTIRGQTLHSQCSTRSQVMPCNLNTPPLLRDKCMASAVSGCRSCCEDLEWVTSRMLWGLTSCKTLSSCQFLLIVQLVTRYKLSKTFSVLVQYLLSVVKCKWHWPGCVCFFELSSAVNWSDKWTRKMIILGPILTSDLTETK